MRKHCTLIRMAQSLKNWQYQWLLRMQMPIHSRYPKRGNTLEVRLSVSYKAQPVLQHKPQMSSCVSTGLNWKQCHINVCTWMFMAASLLIAKSWKDPRHHQYVSEQRPWLLYSCWAWKQWIPLTALLFLWKWSLTALCPLELSPHNLRKLYFLFIQKSKVIVLSYLCIPFNSTLLLLVELIPSFC